MSRICCNMTPRSADAGSKKKVRIRVFLGLDLKEYIKFNLTQSYIEYNRLYYIEIAIKMN